MKPKELVKLLEKDVLFSFGNRGVMLYIVKAGSKIIIVPIHSKDIPTGTLMSILKMQD